MSLSPSIRFCIAALVAALIAAAVNGAAFACACCIPTGWRYVNVDKLDGPKLAEIEQVSFAKQAKLMLGEADDNGIKGVADPEEDYELAVARQKDRMVFSLRDGKGRKGTLTLVLPRIISIFEVDPRIDDKDDGLGPSLFKEWKMTTNAVGDGIFRTATRWPQRMTLVLHGRGKGCTSADQFHAWTLLVHGPVDTFTLYGALDSAAR